MDARAGGPENVFQPPGGVLVASAVNPTKQGPAITVSGSLDVASKALFVGRPDVGRP
ncbi:hypothetical protein GCM10027187_68020 [Streptosporangium sandarakinum]